MFPEQVRASWPASRPPVPFLILRLLCRHSLMLPRRIAIIGAGRLGRTLGFLLHRAGFSIGPVVTQRMRTARAAVRFIGGGSAQSRISRAVLQAEIILIATPDEKIRSVAEQLAQLAGARGLRGRLILHTSGARTSADLAVLKKAGGAVGSLHPLQTFPGSNLDSAHGVWFALEGDMAAVRVARRLVQRLGGKPIPLTPGHKANYHAAAMVASPLLLALAEMAGRMMARSMGNARQAAHALLPLMRQTLDHWARLGARKAWTGPLVRGDLATIRSHWRELRRYPPAYRRAYRALAELSVHLLGKPELGRALRRIWAQR